MIQIIDKKIPFDIRNETTVQFEDEIDSKSEIQLALIDLYVAIKIRDEEEINNYD